MNLEMSPPPQSPVMPRHAGLRARWERGRTWVTRHRRLSITLVATLLVAVGIAIALRPSQKADFRAGRFGGGGPMPVNVATAEKGEIPLTVNALGTVTPLATVTVRPQVTGYIVRIAFQEGQMVKEGDVLAVVDPQPYRLALQQAEGQLGRDQAQLHNAEIDLERYQTLFAQDSIARQQLDTQNALVRQYRGVVQADEAAVGTARLNLERCEIRAPLTGRVGLRQVDQGNYVANGDANGIAVITQVQPISVLFTVPEDQLQQVLQRVRSGAILPVTALDRSQKTRIAAGTLSTIDNKIDTATGTVKLRAIFDNADERLFPNQFVNVELLVDTLKDVTVLPVAAIQRGAPGTFVYAVDKDSKVSVRPVKLGAQTPEKVAVETGAAPGDVVVTDGADRIRDGALVLLPGQEPPKMGSRPAGQRRQGRGPAGQGSGAQGEGGERRGPPPGMGRGMGGGMGGPP
jgi:multidrug efflux system membrane fusion protein